MEIKLKNIHVREILALNEDEVWDHLPHSSVNDKIKLTFDNGETHVVTSRETIFSNYIWRFHRKYPKTQLLPDQHILGRILDKNLYLKLLGKAYFQCYYDNESIGVSREILMGLLYEVTNKIHNMTTGIKLSSYVTSFTILDLLDIADHPRIKKSYMDLKPVGMPQTTSINDVYNVIEDVLKRDDSMIKNPLAFAVRCNLVDMNQAKQMVGPRGQPTDTDNHIFTKTPILPSFVHGLVEVVDCITESRSAAKAHFYQKGPMEKSEYLNRSVQLLCMTLKNLHMTDCGSKGFIYMTVDKKKAVTLAGSRQICEDGSERFLTMDDIYKLHGKTIKLRNIIKCQHPDPIGVCVHCFGAIGVSIPHGTNLGYASSSTILGDVGQNLLSTKHFVSSASGAEVEIKGELSNWIRKGTKTNTFVLSPDLRKDKVSLVIPKDQGQGLNDVLYVDNVKVLQKHLITQLQSFVFEKTLKNGTLEYHEHQLFIDNNTAHLSFEALEYIKQRGFTISPTNEFIIPLDKWDYSKPMFEIPIKQYSTIDFMMSLNRAITGAVTTNSQVVPGSRVVDYNSPEEALVFLFDLVNSRLDCSLSHISVIIYSLMCADPMNNDYSLPRKGAPNKLIPFNRVMRNRSMAPFLAFERQYKPLTTPSTYLIKNRPPHPMDSIFIPKENPVVYY